MTICFTWSQLIIFIGKLVIDTGTLTLWDNLWSNSVRRSQQQAAISPKQVNEVQYVYKHEEFIFLKSFSKWTMQTVQENSLTQN